MNGKGELKMDKLEEIIHQQAQRKSNLVSLFMSLRALDSLGNSEFFGGIFDFYEIKDASEYIMETLKKANTSTLFEFIEQEEKALAQFEQKTKGFENKEGLKGFKEIGIKTAELLENIKQWYKKHLKYNILDVQNGIVLLA